MIINALFAKILIGLLYVGIILFFAWVWKKFKKKPVGGGTLGFFLGTIPTVMLVVLPSKVQIVNGPKSYSTYWAYGKCTYTSQNNKTVQVKSSNLQTAIINDSKSTVEIEEIVYGNPFYEPKIITLKTGEITVLESDISFFFDQKIPDQIDVEFGKFAIEYWLREKL